MTKNRAIIIKMYFSNFYIDI